MSLLLSLRSETLKLKRTLSLYLCLIGAAFGPLMSFLENVNSNETPKVQNWTAHFLEGRDMMTGVLLPWYVILVCALLLQVEYRDKAWKQVLASPQRLFDIFFAKFLSLQLMILLFIVSYTVFKLVAAYATEMVRPELYNGGADVYRIFAANAQTWILSLGIAAIQFWLSLRFRNFIPPLAIGLVAWFLGPMMVFEFKIAVMEYYPYAFTILGVWPDYAANTVRYQWYSIATAVLFLGIAFAEFRTRKMKS